MNDFSNQDGLSTLPTVDATTNRMHKAIDHASDAAGPMVDKLASSAHQATNQVADAISSVGDRIKATHAQAVDCCTDYVREKPVTALLIAFAAGFFMTALVGATRRRSLP